MTATDPLTEPESRPLGLGDLSDADWAELTRQRLAAQGQSAQLSASNGEPLPVRNGGIS